MDGLIQGVAIMDVFQNKLVNALGQDMLKKLYMTTDRTVSLHDIKNMKL